MELSERARQAIDRIIRERFAGRVERVEFELAQDATGEDVLFILVSMNKNTEAGDFRGRFFGLTGRVRDALDGNMRGVFPIIRPVEAHA